MQKKGHDTADGAGQPPRRVPVSTDHPELHYELADEFLADPTDSDPTASIRVSASTSDSKTTTNVGPVYRRVPGGDVVVPTGRVLVRFADGDDAADHAADLKAVGYVVDQVLPYATNTTWVRSATGGITAALSDLDQLSSVRGVIAVEPQMIGSSNTRT